MVQDLMGTQWIVVDDVKQSLVPSSLLYHQHNLHYYCNTTTFTVTTIDKSGHPLCVLV